MNFRRGKVTLFAQTLFGGVWTTDGIAQSTGPENNFAMTAGGGIDFKVSEHVSVRPIQAESTVDKNTRWSQQPSEQPADWHRNRIPFRPAINGLRKVGRLTARLDGRGINAKSIHYTMVILV